MWYLINCMIPVEPKDYRVYEDYEESDTNLEESESMQPTLIYKIEEFSNFWLVKQENTPRTQFWEKIGWGGGL